MRRSLTAALAVLVLVTIAAGTAGAQGSDTKVTVNSTVYNESGAEVGTVQFTTNVSTNDTYGWSANWDGSGSTVTSGYGDNVRFQNGTVVDSFEDGDISEYEGATGFFSVVQSPVSDGSNALQIQSDGNRVAILNKGPSGPAPVPGTNFSVDMYVDNSQTAQIFYFAASNQTDSNGVPDSRYGARLATRGEFPQFTLIGRGDAASTTLDNGVQTGEYYTIEITWSHIQHRVSGYVTDQGGNPIEGAEMSFDDRFNTADVTNESGYYQVYLEDGTYNYEATSGAYTQTNESSGTVTVSGSPVSNVNATMKIDPDTVRLDVPDRMEHNETESYSVIVNGQDVTGGATVGGENLRIDDFEDGDIDEYSGDTGDASVQTSTVKSGSRALQISSSSDSIIYSGSGLERYPESGDTIRYWTRMTSSQSSRMHFGAQSQGSAADSYLLSVSANDDVIYLRAWSGGSAVALDQTATSQPINGGSWYRAEIDWGSGGTITARVYDESGTQLASASISDSSYSSGGIQFRKFAHGGASGNAYWDNVTVDRDVTYNPTVTSNKTNILQVNQNEGMLESFGTSGLVGVTAEVTVGGDDVAVTEPVTVAEVRLEDVTLLTGHYALLAIVTDWTFMFLFIAGLVSAVVCRVAGNDEFVCLGISATLVVALWLFGLVPLYLMVTALLAVGAILFKT